MLDRDGSLIHSATQKPTITPLKRGFAELNHRPDEDQTSRIGRLLSLAFDQLGFRSLELRITEQDAHLTDSDTAVMRTEVSNV